MKISNIIVVFSLVFATCYIESALQQEIKDHTIEYNIDDNKYAVVVVQDEGISSSEAKKYAMQRAAEMTIKNGYRYFVVDSESEVYVAKSNKESPSEPSMPRNIYYELIQSGDFGRDLMPPEDLATVAQCPGYRVVFSCFNEKASRKAVDACKYADCH